MYVHIMRTGMLVLAADGMMMMDGPPHPPTHPAVLQTKVISHANGSTYAEFGSTKIMVGV